MWTWDEIESGWLTVELPPEYDERFSRVGRIDHPHDDVVAAFDKVEACFGRDWIEQRGRMIPGTMAIFAMGRLLDALDGVRNTDKLLKELHEGNPAARSRVAALYFIRADNHDIEAEYDPQVMVNGGPRKTDFRVRLDNGPWTYIEVSRASDSDHKKSVREIQARLADTIRDIRGPVAVEAVLLRKPHDAEVVELERRLRSVSNGTEDIDQALPDGLGHFMVSYSNPERVIGIAIGPNVFVASVVLGGDGQPCRLTIRNAYSDTRANRNFDREAEQLPDDRRRGWSCWTSARQMGPLRPGANS